MAEARERYGPLYAVWAFAMVLVVLMAPVDPLGSGTYVDTTIRGRSAEARAPVEAAPMAMDPAALDEYPREVGKWRTSHQYRWHFLQDFLKADRVVARDYRAPGALAPVTLVFVASENLSSFHSPRTCYTAQRYRILEEHTATVAVPFRSQLADGTPFDGTILAERLVVERTRANGQQDRVMNLHFFVKEEQGRIVQRATWVRVSTFVIPGSDMAAEERHLTEFLGLVASDLVRPHETQPPETVLERVVGTVLDRPSASA